MLDYVFAVMHSDSVHTFFLIVPINSVTFFTKKALENTVSYLLQQVFPENLYTVPLPLVLILFKYDAGGYLKKKRAHMGEAGGACPKH